MSFKSGDVVRDGEGHTYEFWFETEGWAILKLTQEREIDGVVYQAGALLECRVSALNLESERRQHAETKNEVC